MHTARRSSAAPLAFAALLACCIAKVAGGVETLPALDAVELMPEAQPVVPLEMFTTDLGFLQRWQQNHAWRVAQGTMIQTDRPSFTLAPTTVPQGWVQLETGFVTVSAEDSQSTFTWNSFPQMNLRIGILPRVEFRALWGGISTARLTGKSSHGTLRFAGASSTEFGVKIQVSQQRGWLPQSALITDVIIPTGNFYGTPYQLTAFYAWESASPLIDYIYFWRLSERFSVGGSSGLVIGTNNGTTVDHFFQSAILKFHWTRRLTLFTEYYEVFTDQYYGGNGAGIDAGVKWRFFNNAQLDWIIGRPGIHDGNGVFTSAGFSFRY